MKKECPTCLGGRLAPEGFEPDDCPECGGDKVVEYFPTNKKVNEK